MPNEWVGITVGVLGSAMGLGGVIAYGKTGYAKNTNALLRENNAALEETNLRLEREKADADVAWQAEKKDLQDRISRMEGQIKALTDLLTARPEIERLAVETLRQHQEVILKLSDIAQVLAPKQEV